MFQVVTRYIQTEYHKPLDVYHEDLNFSVGAGMEHRHQDDDRLTNEAILDERLLSQLTIAPGRALPVDRLTA